jgi:hypothetical protein
VNEFPDHFKQVFDHDWGHTEAMITDGTVPLYTIRGEGPFSKPGDTDASKNCGHRGGLLPWQRSDVAFRQHLAVPMHKGLITARHLWSHDAHEDQLTPCQFFRMDLTAQLFQYINNMHAIVSEMSAFWEGQRLRSTKLLIM